MSSASISVSVVASAPASIAHWSANARARAIASARGRSLEHLVDLAADLSDRGPNCVGTIAVLDAHDALHACQPVRHQKRSTADREQCHIARLGLDAVDMLFDHRLCALEHALDERWRQVRDPTAIAEIEQAGGDGDIRPGELCAAEHERFLGQPEADALRSDRDLRGVHQASAAKPDRDQVGHPEQRAHAAHMHHRVGLPREAVLQVTEIRRSAADVDDDRVLQRGQVRSAAHRIGRSGCETVDGKLSRTRRGGDCSIVLCDVERRLDAAVSHRVLEAA